MTEFFVAKNVPFSITHDGKELTSLCVFKGKELPLSDFAKSVKAEIEEYLSGKRKYFCTKYKLVGTPFQKAVWAELEKIPYGETKTYGEIAAAIKRPTACRAVGGACNKNPVGIIVPCHRVIGKDGSLVGYAGGLQYKKMLLELEKSFSGGRK